MHDQLIQRASLVGQVIQDITYTPLEPGRYRAELVGFSRPPESKPGGFFVFTNVPAGPYTLRLTGDRLRPRACDVKLPLAASLAPPPAPPFFDLPGEDELIVVARAINGGSRKLTFDQVILPLIIPAGAKVLSANFSSTLSSALGPGTVSEAKVEDASGFAAGAVVRIRRGIAIRMRFDPYYPFSTPITRIVGKVTLQATPTVPLLGALITLTHVNDAPVLVSNVAGAHVATVDLGGGASAMLGTDIDVAASTDSAGYYSLYFTQANFMRKVTVEVTLAGFETQALSGPVISGQRKEMDVELTKSQA
jgi:hypothetical protein